MAPNSLPYLRRDNATIWVCLALHLNDGFARSVHDELCRPSSRALAPSPGLDLKIIARNAVWLRRNRSRHDLVLSLSLLEIASGVVGLVLSAARSGSPAVSVSLLLLGLVGAVVSSIVGAIRQARHVTRLISGDQLWDPGPGSLAPEQEHRLDMVNKSNLCIYSGQISDPFPGLGPPLSKDVIGPVSVTRPKNLRQPVIPFTPSELHAHLGRQLHRTRSDGLTGWNRAYIDESWVRAYPEIYPDASQVPAVQVPGRLVKTMADQPSEGARTFVTGYSIQHGGQLVCSVSARFTLENDTLTWEVSGRILLPVSLAFLEGDLGPYTPVARMTWAVRKALRQWPRDLIQAPATLIGEWYEQRRALWLLKPVGSLTPQEEIKLFGDVGAITSLRQRRSSSGRQGSRLTFNQLSDAQESFQRLMHFFYTEIGTFLADHNIVNGFRSRQIDTIVNNIQAQNVAFGPSSTAGNTTNYSGGQPGGSTGGAIPQPGGP